MGSRKRSARARETGAFKSRIPSEESAGSGGLSEREHERRERLDAEHDEHLRWKACEKKKRYATEGEARLAADACRRHGSRDLHVYRCPYCGGWHLTHKGKRAAGWIRTQTGHQPHAPNNP